MKKYYSVTTKCGHVGKGYYILIDFPVVAENAKEAARIARDIPRVKHNHSDAIREVIEITKEQFKELKENNKNDPYLNAHSKQEQDFMCDLTNRLYIDTHHFEKEKNDKADRKSRIKFKKRNING